MINVIYCPKHSPRLVVGAGPCDLPVIHGHVDGSQYGCGIVRDIDEPNLTDFPSQMKDGTTVNDFDGWFLKLAQYVPASGGEITDPAHVKPWELAEKYHVSTTVKTKLSKEEWFAVDNGDGTYSGLARSLAYTYSGNKITQTVETKFLSDGSVVSKEVKDFYTNPTTGATVEKRS